MEEERTVQRRPEGGHGRHGAAEEPSRQQKDQRDVGDAEHRLAEADAPEAVAREEPHAGERVGVQRRLVKDRLASPPALPGRERRDVTHPRGVRVRRVPAEHVAPQDAPRPLEVGRHVALRPVELVLGERQAGDEPQVHEPGGERDGEHAEERPAPAPVPAPAVERRARQRATRGCGGPAPARPARDSPGSWHGAASRAARGAAPPGSRRSRRRGLPSAAARAPGCCTPRCRSA